VSSEAKAKEEIINPSQTSSTTRKMTTHQNNNHSNHYQQQQKSPKKVEGIGEVTKEGMPMSLRSVL
jgi:hypothetical protein